MRFAVLAGSAVLAAGVVAGFICLAMGITSAPLVSAGLVAMLATAVVPPAVAVMRGRFHLADPVNIVIVTFLAYCFFGPLYCTFFGAFRLPFTPSAGLVFQGLMYSALALASFYGGYYSRFGSQLAGAAPRGGRFDGDRARLAAIGLELFGVALFIAWLHDMGIPLGAVNALSTEYDYGSKTRLAGAISAGYLHLGDGFILAAGLLLASFRPRSKWRWLVDLNTLLIGGFLVITAARWRMLIYFGGLLLMRYAKKGRKPSLAAVAVLGIAFAATMPLIGYYRSISGQKKTALADGETLMRSTMSSISIFDTFLAVVEAVPERIEYQRGNILSEALYYPIPRALWPDKPYSRELEIIWSLTGGRDAGYAAPIFGEMYIQFGVSGIVSGMLLLGIGVRALYMYWRQAPWDRAAQTLLATGAPFIITVIDRGYLLQHLATIFNIYIPLALCLWFSADRISFRRRAKAPSARPHPTRWIAPSAPGRLAPARPR